MGMKTPEELAEEYALELLQTQILFKEERFRAREAYLAGYQAAAPQWISVKDRLPEIGCCRVSDDVLLINKYGEMGVSCFVTWGKEITIKGGEAGELPLEDFTHWMPLPELPTDKQNGE